MQKIVIVIVLFLIIGGAGFLLTSKPESDQQKINSIPTSTFLPVLEQQIEALNKEDADSYLKTIHEGSPSFENTKTLLTDQFKNFNQTFTLVSWEVIGATNDEIKVKVVQTVKNPEGSNTKDTKVTAVHTLKKSGDSWKVYSTGIDKTEYIN